jgi:hypothetical protein
MGDNMVIKKEVNKKGTLNIVKCSGATCVSVDSNYNRYYANTWVKTRPLNVRRYTVCK